MENPKLPVVIRQSLDRALLFGNQASFCLLFKYHTTQVNSTAANGTANMPVTPSESRRNFSKPVMAMMRSAFMMGTVSHGPPPPATPPRATS